MLPAEMPRPSQVSVIAPSAPPSGNEPSEVNETPFTLPVSPLGAAARMIKLSPEKWVAAPPTRLTLKVLLPSRMSTDWPVVPVPTKCTLSGLDFAQVKLAKASQVSAIAGSEAIRVRGMNSASSFTTRIVFYVLLNPKSGSALTRFYYVHVPCQPTPVCQENCHMHRIENTGSFRKYPRLPWLLYAKI